MNSLGLCRFSRETETSIVEPKSEPHKPVTKKFKNWIVGVENHGSNKRISNCLEKSRVEVSE
jgi:hypothetical protein